MKRQTFPEPGCSTCECYEVQGTPPIGTRYCKGGKWKKRGKRFRSSDPQFKAPTWCPKRLSSPACRIYGWAAEETRLMQITIQSMLQNKTISPSPHNYRLRAEFPLGMKAGAFFRAVQEESLEMVLPNQEIQVGEVIEVDDGLKPYYFCYQDSFTVTPVYYFPVEHIQK